MSKRPVLRLRTASVALKALSWTLRPVLESCLRRQEARLAARDWVAPRIWRTTDQILGMLSGLAASEEHPEPNEEWRAACRTIRELGDTLKKSKVYLPRCFRRRVRRFMGGAVVVAALFHAHYGAPDWRRTQVEMSGLIGRLAARRQCLRGQFQSLGQGVLVRALRGILRS